jgi:hypothetical protein
MNIHLICGIAHLFESVSSRRLHSVSPFSLCSRTPARPHRGAAHTARAHNELSYTPCRARAPTRCESFRRWSYAPPSLLPSPTGRAATMSCHGCHLQAAMYVAFELRSSRHGCALSLRLSCSDEGSATGPSHGGIA